MTWTHGFSEQSLGNPWAWGSAPVSKLSSMGIHSSCVSHPTSPQFQAFFREISPSRTNGIINIKRVHIAILNCKVNMWDKELDSFFMVLKPGKVLYSYKMTTTRGGLKTASTTSEGTQLNTMLAPQKHKMRYYMPGDSSRDLFIP